MTSSNPNVASWGIGAVVVSASAAVLANSSDPGGPNLPSSTDMDAARFLLQASFGPTDQSIASVRQLGIAGWIAQQADPAQTPSPTDFVAWIDRRDAELKAADPANRPVACNRQFEEAFWASVIADPDQLRQRMAFALSQIMVVSFQGSQITPRIAGAYWNVLRQRALGNYFDLLKAVTLSGAMGMYLNIAGNAAADNDPTRHPDENYAREIMQLMSIGPVQLNLDGSSVLDVRGQPVPTYTHDDIVGLAKVFTGLGWNAATATARSFYRPIETGADIKPLMPYPQYHSRLSKTFLGKTLPALSAVNPSDAALLAYQTNELDAALHVIVNHPNVGPFLGRRLIQQFVKSNPSPDYVRRVANAFNNNGKGVRGDLLATITAVLTDAEARPSTLGTFDGKLREPIMRLANWLRAFGATSASKNYIQPYAQDGWLGDPSHGIGQAPLQAATVFNFWSPDYAPPNTPIAAAGKFAPEFQAVDVLTAAGYANRMLAIIQVGNIGQRDISTTYKTEQALTDSSGLVDPNQLILRINMLLCGGQMGKSLMTRIVNVVNSTSIPAKSLTTTQIAALNLNRVRSTISLTMMSTDYLIQR